MSQEDRFFKWPPAQRSSRDADWCRETEAWVRITAALLTLILLTLSWHENWPAWLWKFLK
jgi:hypothetical protein